MDRVSKERRGVGTPQTTERVREGGGGGTTELSNMRGGYHRAQIFLLKHYVNSTLTADGRELTVSAGRLGADHSIHGGGGGYGSSFSAQTLFFHFRDQTIILFPL